MTGKLTKWPQNITTSSISRPSKIYPKWYFGLKIYHLATLRATHSTASQKSN
jgi:quinol-cytochrome oxidoreductase complex cytochrome b subunit